MWFDSSVVNVTPSSTRLGPMEYTRQERESIKASVRGDIASLTNPPIADLLRMELGAELNFAAAQPALEAAREVASALTNPVLDALPSRVLSNAASSFGPLMQLLREIGEFRIAKVTDLPRGQNVVDVQRELLNRFRTGVDTFIDDMSPVLGAASAFYVIREGSRLMTDLTNQLTTRIAEATTARDEIRHLAEESRHVLDATRNAAAEVGVSQHSRHFAEAADEHAQAARMWLLATVIAAIVTFAMAVGNLFLSRQAQPVMVQFIIAKVITLSVLVSATVWCGRMYRAQRHNTVVNQHRRNALSSFEAFAESTSDPATKDAVLRQATQSIFSPQPSGYIASEAEQSGTPQLIELVRNIAAPAK